MKILRLCAVLVVLALVTFAVAAQDEETEFIHAGDLEAKIAQDWMTLLYDRIEAEGISAPAGARMYGYAGVALYEAVVNGIPGNNSLAGQIDHMPDLSLPEEGVTYDWVSVANATLAGVIADLFPNPTDETLAAIEDLRAEWEAARVEELSTEIVAASMTYGETLAEEINAWIADDYFAETRDLAYEIPTGFAGAWVLTTDGTKAAEPYWGQLRPFTLEWSDECAVLPTMEFSTDEDSTFYAQAMEVKEVGDELTEEQMAIARHWVDTPGMTGTPAGHWVMIENQLVDQLDLSLELASEMYAMVGMALADSFISCWSLKYQVLLMRPVTYINANIRRSWAPYIETPPFPEYPSGHSVVSAAAAEVLTQLFGTVAFTDSTHVDRGEAPRHYTSFEAAAQEAAISRLYGGIHFRSAIESGMRQGRCVGERIRLNIRLNPIRQGE